MPSPLRRRASPEPRSALFLAKSPPRKPAEADQRLKDCRDRTFHSAPTSASRMHAVEGLFSGLSRRRLKQAFFNSLDECVAAIEGCKEHQNANDARPFRRSRKPEDLAEARKKGTPEAEGIGIVKKNQNTMHF